MCNIVIVDDETRIADGLARIIQQFEFDKVQTQVLYDSEEALQFISHHRKSVSALVTDICMPKLSGLELVEKIRKFTPNLPCLILTGFEEFEYAKKAISLGVVNYLLKPVDPQELRENLEMILSKKKAGQYKAAQENELSNAVSVIKSEIEHNYRSFSLDELADRLHLRKDYLGRIFKKETEMNIVDYLTEIRLARAKELLRQVEQYKVYEVSYLVGYDDNAYFSRLFKQKYGVTPKDYQKYGSSQ